ncbi:hypothetical protein LCGC14_2002960, partial [marine sediment metagenome]
ELLIVVAILGVLAAVVIPNVMRFIGAGEQEARDTELANIQAAVSAMMVDNNLALLPTPVGPLPGGASTNDMNAFPDTSALGVALKEYDRLGNQFIAPDLDGYLLYQHDVIADTSATPLVNYVAEQITASYYSVDEFGTVKQWRDNIQTPY